MGPLWGGVGKHFFSWEWVPYLPEYVCQIWLRSDGRVEKKGGTDRQTDKRTLQLYIVLRLPNIGASEHQLQDSTKAIWQYYNY